jgi:hypothetical protein
MTAFSWPGHRGGCVDVELSVILTVMELCSVPEGSLGPKPLSLASVQNVTCVYFTISNYFRFCKGLER